MTRYLFGTDIPDPTDNENMLREQQLRDAEAMWSYPAGTLPGVPLWPPVGGVTIAWSAEAERLSDAGAATERMEGSELKAEALNEMARGLAAATTLEECRGLALSAFRKMLDIIYPEEDKA